MQSSSFQSRQDPIAEAFYEYCGPELFDRFVKTIDDRSRYTARLQFWQEQLWSRFAVAFKEQTPSSPAEIAAIFGLQIPCKTLNWLQIADELPCILDLVQTPSGSRYVQPRAEFDLPTPHTVVSTIPIPGRELRDHWQTTGAIKLENGEGYGVDPHGSWMTITEIQKLKADRQLARSQRPWITEAAPRLATKTKHQIEEGSPFLKGERKPVEPHAEDSD